MLDILSELNIINRYSSCITVVVFVWFFVILAVFCDLWDGVYTARKMHERIRSHKIRHTVDKICEYWRVLFIALLLDLLATLASMRYNLPYASLGVGALFVGVEGKSMFEHLKRRKSAALQIKDVLQGIIKCANQKDAVETLKIIKEYFDANEKK